MERLQGSWRFSSWLDEVLRCGVWLIMVSKKIPVKRCDMYLNIGDRLRGERERLGFTQPAFGSIGGVQKLAQLKYEKGERFPGADYLAAIAKVGADVQYIVTGERCSGALSADENELIDRFRAAPLAVRASALAGLAAGAEPQSKGARKQVFHGSVGQVVEGSITNEAGVSFNFGVDKNKE
jgi:transcriptional regulator with XRE-family HTH domain